jgi:hypothetical protein
MISFLYICINVKQLNILITMARFKIEQEGKPTKWVKFIDKVNQKIEFTNDEDEAYDREGGFYPMAELQFIKHYFMDEFPELEYCKLDDEYEY